MKISENLNNVPSKMSGKKCVNEKYSLLHFNEDCTIISCKIKMVS